MCRYSIRELVLMTVIVALAAAWWADRGRLSVKLNRSHAANIMLARKLVQAGYTQGFWIPLP